MLDHVLHCCERGPRFGQKGLGHREAEGNVIGDDENETGGNGFREMFGDEKRVARQLKEVIPMRTPCRVFVSKAVSD